MKQTSQWDDLLIICLPDHGFYYPEEGNGHAARIHHIPMLWLGGAIKQPMVIDKIMNQTDMAATLLAQLGLNHDATFGGGCAFADSTGVTLYDLNSDRVADESPSPNSNRLQRVKAILQSSYDDLGSR